MASLDRSRTRDPFGGLIVSQTIAAGAQLVTADRTTREHLPATIW